MNYDVYLSMFTFFQYFLFLFSSSLTNSLSNINDNTVLTVVEIISIITTIIMNPRLIQLGGVCPSIPQGTASLWRRPRQQRPLATDTCMTPGIPKSPFRPKGGLDFPWTHDLHLPRPWRLWRPQAHPGEVGVVGLLVGPLASCPATDPHSLRQQPQVRVVQWCLDLQQPKEKRPLKF